MSMVKPRNVSGEAKKNSLVYEFLNLCHLNHLILKPKLSRLKLNIKANAAKLHQYLFFPP